MNPNLIYKKIESLFHGSVSDFPLRFATDPSDLPEGYGYISVAVSLQATPDLETNHTAEATIEFSLVMPIIRGLTRAGVEAKFETILSILTQMLTSFNLNDEETSGDAPVHFYSVHPDNVPVPEYDEFRITQSITFKASVQF